MGAPFFHEFKKQASFFLRERIKHARLALTDVTPAELLTEDATSGNPWPPDAKTMSFISRSAFEIDDFWRIVQILHKRFNWGFAVRKKSERVLKLLEKGPVLKEERDRARKVTIGIRGFGSFNQRWTSNGAIDGAEHSSDYFGRWNSHYEAYSQQFSNSDAESGEKKIILTGERSVNGEIAVKKHERGVGEDASVGDGPPEESKLNVELQNEEHPFNCHELQRLESKLLLKQS